MVRQPEFPMELQFCSYDTPSTYPNDTSCTYPSDTPCMYPDDTPCTYLNEVGQQGTAEFLLQDDCVGLVDIATGDKGGEQNGGQAGITEILEWQGTHLLQDGGGLAGLNHYL